MFRQNILSKLTSKSNINKPVKRVQLSKDKQAEVIKLSPLILTRPPKKVLEKSKFFNKKDNIVKESAKPKNKQLYTQVSITKVNNILKLKENFFNILAKKIENIHRMINDLGKVKPRINMTTKGPSRKQIIIPIGNNNKSKFIASLNLHITNLNSMLRNIKLDVMADFVQANKHSIIITMNKIALPLDLQTIKNYIKNIDHIDSNNVEMSHLPQFKSYLKIIDIPYLMENNNTPINSSVVETILKNDHIFNNISLTLKSQVIKMLSKLDMVIVWLDT